MTDAPWINMADWSGLPDVYVTKAECQHGMFWRIEACSVPMAIGPEVRLVRADIHAAALDREAAMKAELARVREALERSKRLRDQYRKALDDERNHSNPARAALTPEPEGDAP